MSNASLELGGGKWGTKDGNLLGYASSTSSSKFVPREFTFTRGSDIAATRINSSGSIEKYRENLLLQSNQFDTTWTTSNASVTSGQSGYDGSSDAWLLKATGTSSTRVQQTISTDLVQTISVYAKKGTSDYFQIRLTGSTTAFAFFDLANGTLGTLSNQVDASITSVGNGWYRCSLVRTGAATSARIYVTGNNTTSVSVGDNIYIQDAQLERGLVATSYLDSGATKATSGVADNEPRIDYAGGTASLLLEPQRSNLITQSEYFGGYSNSNSTDEPNATTSPEGLTNATSFLEAATTGQHKLFTSLIFNGSSTYTFSIFAKSNGRDLYVDTQNSNEWGGRAWFDLTAGTANAVLGTADIEDYGNGWYRCIVTGASTLNGGNFIELLTSNGSSNSTTGDITKGVYIYGAQLEIGSYPTSYIPTYGTSVTRNEDSFQNSTNDKPLGAIGQGTWFVELQKLGDDTNQALYLAPTTNNTQQIRLHFDVSNARFRDARNGYATIGGAVNVKTSLNKMALSIDTTSGIAKVYGNGSQLGSDYTLQANTFEFSRIVAEGKGFILKQSLFFPNALSDAELAALTT